MPNPFDRDKWEQEREEALQITNESEVSPKVSGEHIKVGTEAPVQTGVSHDA